MTCLGEPAIPGAWLIDNAVHAGGTGTFPGLSAARGQARLWGWTG